MDRKHGHKQEDTELGMRVDATLKHGTTASIQVAADAGHHRPLQSAPDSDPDWKHDASPCLTGDTVSEIAVQTEGTACVAEFKGRVRDNGNG